MKQNITFFFFLLLAIGAKAQNISVKSFKPLPNDMTASSLEGKRIDQNGQVAALIKMVTTQTGFTFEGGTLGIVDTKQEAGEVWVWVPRAARKITIKHPQLGVLRDYAYPIEIEAERTYEMVLTTAKVETIFKEDVNMQYLAFQITPANATLEVNDQLWTVEADGSAQKYVSFGTYSYRVRAADHLTEAGKVTVDDPNNTKIVVVKLKPNFAEITLKVDADADIWVNNEKKGTRTWKGPLGSGTYKIECKLANHESSVITKEITADMGGQTIILPAPRPIYGSLNVESTPGFAKLYIDGKDMGTTPKSIPEILIGRHELRLTMEGYKDYSETIAIAQGERKQVKAVMESDGTTPPTVKPQQPQQPEQSKPQKPVAEKPANSVFFVMGNFAYSIAPQTSFGLTVGAAKKMGWYVSASSNFSSRNGAFECDSDGNISGVSYEYSYSGTQKTSRLSATAGMVLRIADPVYFHVGGGYGFRNLLWELNNSGSWVKNTDYSYQGLALDAGLMLHFGGFGLSVGVQTIGVKYMEAKIGIGYTLKKR